MINKRFLAVILPFGLGYLICTVFRSINAVLGPVLVSQFHFSNAQLGALTSVYVLAFALSQIPLGVLLDRYGPRAVQTSLFLLGGLSIIGFALSSSFTLFTITRALLGIAMSAGLMAAFKAVSLTSSKSEIPKLNGIIMGFGGIGALIATSPAHFFIHHFGWRTLCFSAGGLTLLIALTVLLLAPKNTNKTAVSLKQQLIHYKDIFQHHAFIRLTPLIVTGLGSFIAVQGLWEGTWLQHVVRFSATKTAYTLLFTAIAMTVGMLSGGIIAKISKRLNLSLQHILAGNGLCLIIVLALIGFNFSYSQILLWTLYGFFGQTVALGYAVVAQLFLSELSGRVNTSVNVLIFLFAFLSQYLMGMSIHLLAQNGLTLLRAYQYTFAGILVLQVLAFLWYICFRSRKKAIETN